MLSLGVGVFLIILSGVVGLYHMMQTEDSKRNQEYQHNTDQIQACVDAGNFPVMNGYWFVACYTGEVNTTKLP
jgi:hypothetical protein